MRKNKNSALKEAQEQLKQYQMFYPDTTMTRLSQEGDFVNEEMMEIIHRLERMTHTAVLYVMMAGNTAYIFKSKHFRTVADKLAKKGTKVFFCDPREPHRKAEGVIMEDGIYYEGGAACIHLECERLGLRKEDVTFALFWQPTQ